MCISPRLLAAGVRRCWQVSGKDWFDRHSIVNAIVPGADLLDCAANGCTKLEAAIGIAGIIPGGKLAAPLKVLHTDAAMSKATLEYFRKMDTDSIVKSLAPIRDNVEPLIVKANGLIMQGNHRVQVLMERGFDVNSLSRVLHKPR